LKQGFVFCVRKLRKFLGGNRSMNPSMPSLKLSHLAQCVGALFMLSASAAFGQATLPDAGSLTNINKDARPQAPAKSPSFEVQQEVRPALVTPGGAKVKVRSFKVTGSSAFSAPVLESLLAGYVGKELDLAGLDEAAGTISQFYRKKGYFVARAYLPVQEVASGNLEIAVVEGRLGAVKFNRKGDARLKESVASAVMAGSAAPGAPINEANIERGLMLLNDLPGIDVKSTLVPGATPGTSDLVVETTEGKMVGGSVDIDNYGNVFTGAARAGVTLNADDISGNGDQLAARMLTSGSGLSYGRLAYILPVGDSGTKLGLATSALRYALEKDFAPLRAKGTSQVGTIYAVQPFVRSRNANFYGTVSFDSKKLRDEQLGKNTTDKSINVFSLGLSGDLRDAAGGGGMTSASLTFTGGDLDLGGNAIYAATDAVTTKSAGGYSKMGFSLARLQRLDDAWSAYVNLSGQTASKNLDSSEKFTLGGLGVRAYPQGEAAADEGTLLNLEARYSVPGYDGNLQLIGFIDTGYVRLHNKTWTGWQPIGKPNFPNSYNLSGIGFGANLFKASDYFIRASVAWKLGSNPGADASGRDSDNTNNSGRFWLQASKQF
jgi:hemolysin activation/secretion protein